MADAFRTAFEHQLKRTNDQTLRITEVGKLHRKYLKKWLVSTQSKEGIMGMACNEDIGADLLHEYSLGFLRLKFSGAHSPGH